MSLYSKKKKKKKKKRKKNRSYFSDVNINEIMTECPMYKGDITL